MLQPPQPSATTRSGAGADRRTAALGASLAAAAAALVFLGPHGWDAFVPLLVLIVLVLLLASVGYGHCHSAMLRGKIAECKSCFQL